MTTRSRVLVATLGLALAACTLTGPPAGGPGDPPPTKGWPGTPDIHDSAYRAVDRSDTVPTGYGLYTVLLTRTANRNALRLLSELFAATGSAGDAAIARENLNLVMIPVKRSADATLAMAAAREQPAATATAVMQKSYDFGQAALLLASVCRPERGAAVMKACGSATPDGPVLVTGLRPLDAAGAAGQRLLVVNLGDVPPAAVGEVVAAYRRQILRQDFADRAELDGWRLTALNVALDAARLLPGISKAYAGGK